VPKNIADLTVTALQLVAKKGREVDFGLLHSRGGCENQTLGIGRICSIRGTLMKRNIVGGLAVSALLVVASLSTAIAADMPLKAAPSPPVPAYSWTGFYIGGTAGGAFGSFDPSTSTASENYLGPTGLPAVNAAGPQSIKPTGFTGGFETGYNWQVSNFVIGFEGDVEYLGLKGNAATSGTYSCCAGTIFTVFSNASTTWLATARARAGIAANDWLFFATGGAAFTNIKANFGFSDNCGVLADCSGGASPNGAEAAAFSSTKTGYAVGGGVEKAIGQNWTIKAEYLYVGFGTVTGTGVLSGSNGVGGIATQLMTHSYDLKANIVRLGINYKFGGPVGARY
jgi:outer membrane immunogenic protein